MCTHLYIQNSSMLYFLLFTAFHDDVGCPPPNINITTTSTTITQGRAMIERAKTGNNCRVLLRTIIARHKRSFAAAIFLQCIATGLTFVNVVLLNQLLGYMQSRFTGSVGISEASAYVITAMMFVNPMINSLLVSHSNRFALGAQVRIRADLASALYRKALRLSSEYVVLGWKRRGVVVDVGWVMMWGDDVG